MSDDSLHLFVEAADEGVQITHTPHRAATRLCCLNQKLRTRSHASSRMPPESPINGAVDQGNAGLDRLQETLQLCAVVS